MTHTERLDVIARLADASPDVEWIEDDSRLSTPELQAEGVYLQVERTPPYFWRWRFSGRSTRQGISSEMALVEALVDHLELIESADRHGPVVADAEREGVAA